MTRINFEFSDLEAFLAVAELGSFQRAAEQMNISQPALTRRIQKFETTLGVVLFERTTRSLKLTLAAKRLRGRAQMMLDDAAEAQLAIRDDSAQYEYQRNAIVTIALVPSATNRILPDAIRLYRDEGHTARIRILDRLANDVAESVSQGDADFGISSIPALEPNLEFDLLTNDRFVLAAPKEHAVVEEQEIAWSSLSDTALILPMKGTGNRMLIDEALARSRKSAKWAFEVRRTTTALTLVEAGIGLAVLPGAAISDGANEKAVARPLTGPRITRTIGVVRRAGQPLTKAAEAFLDALKRTVG